MEGGRRNFILGLLLPPINPTGQLSVHVCVLCVSYYDYVSEFTISVKVVIIMLMIKWLLNKYIYIIIYIYNIYIYVQGKLEL